MGGMKTAMGSRMEADATADGPERRPRPTLASAVMFVADLDRSVDFYRELLGLEATTRDDDAALLVSPDGYQLYLRTMGERALLFSGTIGIQYLMDCRKRRRPRPMRTGVERALAAGHQHDD